jgi:hypothetical protein
MVLSFGHATVSSTRTSTTTRAGITVSFSQREWPTVFISVPQSGQTRSSGGTSLGTSMRCRCAGSVLRPPRRRRLRLSSSPSARSSSAAGGFVTPAMPKRGRASWRSSRASVSDRGRLRRSSATFLVSSMLIANILAMSATIAVTSSTKLSVAIFCSSHARTAARSGT